MRHDKGVGSATFSPDGTRVITDSGLIWDPYSGQPISERVGDRNIVNLANFSPDGMRLVAALTDNTARIWDVLPPYDASSPVWLPDLAEAVGGLKLSDSGAIVSVDADKIFQLKAQLANASGDDFWSKVGRWFFADRDTRTISPQSTITIPEYRAREAEAAKQAAPAGGH